MKCSSLKHSGSETKILSLDDTRAASALRCEVLGCCSQDGLPSLLPILGLAIGPHPIVTAVTKPWHLNTQFKFTSKA
jgi:hypothetical protein